MKAFIEAEPFVVRVAAGKPADILFKGDEAAPHEEALLKRLETLPLGSLLAVDFGNVLISSEAARRLLRRALRRILSGELEDRYLLLDHLGPSRYNIEVMLKGEGLTMVERTEEGGAVLLGPVEPAVRQTYEFLRERLVVTARDLQDGLGLPTISAATNRLTTLAKLALARRVGEEPVPGGGRQYVYAAVK